LAAGPIDPKLKEMASAGLNKAEGLATAVESGKDVVAAVSGEAKDVVKEALAEALPVPPAALAEKVAEVLPASPVVQSVGSIGSEPAIGILIVSAPPVAAAETVAAETVAAETVAAEKSKDEPPPEVQVVVEEPKTEDVQDWGAAK